MDHAAAVAASFGCSVVVGARRAWWTGPVDPGHGRAERVPRLHVWSRGGPGVVSECGVWCETCGWTCRGSDPAQSNAFAAAHRCPPADPDAGECGRS